MQVSWLDAKGIGNAASNNGESVLVLGLKEENHNIIVTCRADNKIGDEPIDKNIRILHFYNLFKVQPSKYGFILDIYTVETTFPL